MILIRNLAARCFRNMKIRRKALLTIILIMFASNGALYLCTYAIYFNSAKDKGQSYSTNMINQMINYSDSYFQDIESFALSLAYNTIIQYSLGNLKNPYDYDVAIERKHIDNSLKLIVYARNDLQIAMFSEHNENLFYTSYTNVNPNYNFKEDDWYKSAALTSAMNLFISDNSQNYYVPEDRKPVYTLLYKINNMFTLETAGYILMDIDKQQFDKVFESNYLDVEDTLILDRDNDIIYSYPGKSDVQVIIEQMPYGQEKGYFNISMEDGSYLVVYGTSNYSKWKIINVINIQTLMTDIGKVKILFLAVAAILFAAAVIVLFYSSLAITNPIVRLKSGMEKIKSGQTDIVLPISSNDEIGDLTSNFNSMVQQIDYLIKKNETIALLKKETELRALQQQINPHFLYNTLENVIGLSGEGKNEKVIAICKNLGYMFRFNLNGKSIVPVSDEIEQSMSYVKILEDRFDGKFKAMFFANPDILEYKIMKFLLQPFVENSITHGFRNILDGGLLSIQADWADSMIRFEIWDNGEGIEQSKLDSIKHELAEYNIKQIEKIDIPQHLGISNVYLRLKLLYNDKFNFSLVSDGIKGTFVRIEIPRIENHLGGNC